MCRLHTLHSIEVFPLTGKPQKLRVKWWAPNARVVKLPCNAYNAASRSLVKISLFCAFKLLGDFTSGSRDRILCRVFNHSVKLLVSLKCSVMSAYPVMRLGTHAPTRILANGSTASDNQETPSAIIRFESIIWKRGNKTTSQSSRS